jgi:hypothetical protein
MPESKFALYDFKGQPREWFVVDELPVPKPVMEATVSHHVVVVDRSGSMWGVMDDTKAMIEKVMVAEEFTSSELLLTLISYSSKGDFTTHFARRKVSDVLDPKSGLVDQIRGLRATCLTSVSGALDEALNHIVLGETTAVSIHTDGYFNDSSPGAEAKLVDRWIKRVQTDYPAVFVNTISYGNWTDFKVLDRISQSLSGKTVVAKSVKQVYDALHDTSSLLAGRVLPAIHVPGEADAFLAFHNLTQRKVNGAATDFAVKGVGPDDETRLYRFRRLNEEAWRRAPVAENADPVPAYVYARSMLAQQRLNDAKYALVGTGDDTLISRHYRALTASALSELAVDLERRIAGDRDDFFPSASRGLGFSKASVLEVCELLGRSTKDFTLSLPEFLGSYKRRGVARVNGRWVDGKFVATRTQLEATDEATLVRASSFDINNTTATINMTVERPARLLVEGTAVPAVAGRKLELTEIRSYTLVGDGEINAASLPIRISSKRLHDVLVGMGVLPDGAFDPSALHVLDLASLPACPLDRAPEVPDASLFSALVSAAIDRGILSAYLGGTGTADAWTPEQLEELKSYDLSSGLNYNPPTTNPYTDLNAAVSAGEVDSRTSYNITLGDSRMVSAKALYSANEYLTRRFSLLVTGADASEVDKDGFLKKPKLSDLWRDGTSVFVKTLSARTKLNAIDDLTMPKFEAFLKDRPTRERAAELLADAEAAVESCYSRLRPLAFYIGATGLVPEGWSVDVLDADALEARFPGIDIEKKQREGTFLVVGSVVIGIFPEVEYFSTERGVEVAKALA